MSEQQMQLFRVTDRIGELVIEFFGSVAIGGTFHAEDLRKFVDSHCKSAPGSADRVMRSLRKKGVINYTVINRTYSLYRRDLIERNESDCNQPNMG
jgi:hypothetical protein